MSKRLWFRGAAGLTCRRAGLSTLSTSTTVPSPSTKPVARESGVACIGKTCAALSCAPAMKRSPGGWEGKGGVSSPGELAQGEDEGQKAAWGTTRGSFVDRATAAARRLLLGTARTVAGHCCQAKCHCCQTKSRIASVQSRCSAQGLAWGGRGARHYHLGCLMVQGRLTSAVVLGGEVLHGLDVAVEGHPLPARFARPLTREHAPIAHQQQAVCGCNTVIAPALPGAAQEHTDYSRSDCSMHSDCGRPV